MERPALIADLPEARRVHLDVREEIGAGRETFPRIMTAVKRLGADQALVLRYAVRGDGSVWFFRAAEPPADSAPSPAPAARQASVVLDVRGLEPPHPMVRVLQEAERLALGSVLEVRHERRPIFLYPQLDERGFTHETDEPEPGVIRILIRRREA